MIEAISWRCDRCETTASMPSQSGRQELPPGWWIPVGDSGSFCSSDCMHAFKEIVSEADARAARFRERYINRRLRQSRDLKSAQVSPSQG